MLSRAATRSRSSLPGCVIRFSRAAECATTDRRGHEAPHAQSTLRQNALEHNLAELRAALTAAETSAATEKHKLEARNEELERFLVALRAQLAASRSALTAATTSAATEKHELGARNNDMEREGLALRAQLGAVIVSRDRAQQALSR